MKSALFELRVYYLSFAYLTASLLTEIEFSIACFLQEIFPDTKPRGTVQKLICELNIRRTGEVPKQIDIDRQYQGLLFPDSRFPDSSHQVRFLVPTNQSLSVTVDSAMDEVVTKLKWPCL
jgi:hypothetical protein